ncbi:hypothetical protein BJX68DRAFT_223017 [Aspergillus pseudodeflectus]|uniref:Uncharacterized protein n=1 Tax=Aspergillus pseudodeflectus TaxID=176178 RepID=A0ABR4LB20_9EURO
MMWRYFDAWKAPASPACGSGALCAGGRALLTAVNPLWRSLGNPSRSYNRVCMFILWAVAAVAIATISNMTGSEMIIMDAFPGSCGN